MKENNNPETGLTDVSESFTLVDHLQTRVHGLTRVDSVHEPPKDNAALDGYILHKKQRWIHNQLTDLELMPMAAVSFIGQSNKFLCSPSGKVLDIFEHLVLHWCPSYTYIVSLEVQVQSKGRT